MISGSISLRTTRNAHVLNTTLLWGHSSASAGMLQTWFKSSTLALCSYFQKCSSIYWFIVIGWSRLARTITVIVLPVWEILPFRIWTEFMLYIGWLCLKHFSTDYNCITNWLRLNALQYSNCSLRKLESFYMFYLIITNCLKHQNKIFVVIKKLVNKANC